MELIERKVVKGHPYYYYSIWEWLDGRSRRVFQRYLGKPSVIADAVLNHGQSCLTADLFEWGLSSALCCESDKSGIVSAVDSVCPKREQGLSVGQYIAIAAINRAIAPVTKRSMWDWFSHSSLVRSFPLASKPLLSSQRFWDHMDRIQPEHALRIFKTVLAGVIEREHIDLSSVSYDGTNYYTFLDTFNTRCDIAKRGKNKQGRMNLRQISLALFCSADGQLPLYYELYEGNRNDAKQFPLMLERFNTSLTELAGIDRKFDTTLVFDKGNNSEENFALVDALHLHYVSSVKLDQVKELAQVSNQSPRFSPCKSPALVGAKAFRLTREIYGRNRTMLVVFNQNLYDTQLLTLHQDIAKAIEELSQIRQRLDDRAAGLIKGGKCPTKASIENQCRTALSRQYTKDIIKTEVTTDEKDLTHLEYHVDAEQEKKIADTYLGKNILVSDRTEWSDDAIIKAYRSQFMIEEVFKQSKDRQIGTWWPLSHWTDSKIQVHGLYCTLALLLRAVALRRVHQAGIEISMKRLHSELRDVREVVTIGLERRNKKSSKQQSVLSKTTELQDRIITALGLGRPSRNPP